MEYNRYCAACGDVGEVAGLGEVERTGDVYATASDASVKWDVLTIESVAVAIQIWMDMISHEALDCPFVTTLAVHGGGLSCDGHGFVYGGESFLPREDGYYGEQRGEDFLTL